MLALSGCRLAVLVPSCVPLLALPYLCQRSELVASNAMTVAAGPVARIKLPQRVPFGFHGTWLPD